ncbi:MAG TPA: GEVED domain-containing protein [Flavobacteriales bacterium]|nr:GEVED domain-containing protein [Flavobacteriales bacterium]
MKTSNHSAIVAVRSILWCLLLVFALGNDGKAQYCSATATGTCYHYLGQVVYGTINQVTACANYTSFYKDWSATASTTVVQGTSQNMTLYNTSSYGTYFRVYIDWNADLDFVDAGELVLTSGFAASGGNYVVNITVPGTATLGTTRIRIKADYYNNFGGGPCASSAETETQDYGLVITAPAPGTLTGTINSYQAVTAICLSDIYVPVPTTFAVGDKVLLIQMRGHTIDIAGTTTYGDITATNNCGKYEFLIVSAITATSVRTVTNPQFTYDITGQVQLVKVASYSLASVTVSSSGITCPAWNGSTGGVIVLENTGDLILNGNIDATGKGFRGGAPDNAAWGCNNAASHGYAYAATSTFSAPKGEGTGSQLITAANTEGKGKASNGGGGGNNVDAGGAGGGNGAIGGMGGMQWASCADPLANETQGIAGASLAPFYSNAINRIFMGGAGGGGHAGANVAGGGAGANGGGIIIITASNIIGPGSIISNGNAAVNLSGQWAGGGGGAGGTILLTYQSVVGSVPVSTRGGNGGPAYWPNQLGPGGGGSGGVLWVSGGLIPAAITYTTTGGTAGTWNNDLVTYWGATNGTTGISVTGLSMPSISTIPGTPCSVLPIELVAFNAVAKENSYVDLSWSTASEINSNYFEVEKTTDGVHWELVTTQQAKGTTNITHNYADKDLNPFKGESYYRLKMVDGDGSFVYSEIQQVFIQTPHQAVLYPNPSSEFITVEFEGKIKPQTSVEVRSALGDLVTTIPLNGDVNQFTFAVDRLPNGVYFLLLNEQRLRFVVQH